MRLRYRELDLELISLGEVCFHLSKRPPMVEEKGEEKERYPFNFLLEVSLT
jgi:hypothetical protein